MFDYIDGAAEDERTLAANSAAFARTTFRPRVLRDVGKVDPATTLLGRPLPLPLVLAPTGFTRIADPEGELAVARSAVRAGLLYTSSTLSTRSIEEVAAASDGPKRFQVYDTAEGARDGRAGRSGRLRGAGPHRGHRGAGPSRAGRARGFTPPKIGPGTLVDGALHLLDLGVRAGRADPFANVVGGDVGDGSDAVSLADTSTASSTRPCRGATSSGCAPCDGPVVLKGIQIVEDAVLAAEAGVEAIALSNHGAGSRTRRRRAARPRPWWPRWWATGSR